jgi:uncharacterized membrane protein YccC
MVEHDSTFDDEQRGCRGERNRGGHRSRHGRRRARKARVLHTRISDSLAEDIRRIAEDLRVPTSNLVRNVLEEVFDVVESVSDDVGGLFEEVLDEAEAARQRIASARSRARGRRPRDVERARDRSAWEAARAEVEQAERGGAGPRGAPPPPPIDWHVVEAGRALGPLRREELAEAARAGRLQRETLVWSAGMPDWLPAGDVNALAELFAPPPVPDAKGAQGDDAEEPANA